MRNKYLLITFMVCTLSFANVTFSASFEPEWGRDGMVTSSVSPAAPVGQAILEKGGNAIDAVIASSFAASVAHPFSSGLGGGMFAVVHDAESGESVTLDAREIAPAGATAEFYRENPTTIRTGARSVGVPGLVQGLWALHQKYGSMPWEDLIEPAISLAENGVPISIWHHNIVGYVAKALDDFPETRRIQTIDGAAPPLGWNLVQTDLAATLRLIQQKGGQALAVGPVAKKIEQATDGAVTELDLARYTVKWRDPITANYRGYRVVAMPPPSSGGVLLAEMLNVLQRFDLASMGKGSSEYIHLVGSTGKLAFADRAEHLGDPDFHSVPIERLTSMAHADDLASRYRADGQPVVNATLNSPPDDSGTTHISVMDRFGNAVALTQTINTLFGSKITVPGTGIVLNNEMDDFSIDTTTPNAWQAVGSSANSVIPGKRPLSSMTPLVVLKDDRAVMALGGSMGTMIISSVLQTLLNVIDFGYDAAAAVMAPRFHHQWQPDKLFMEPEFSQDVRSGLESRGHELADRSMVGAAQLVIFDAESCYFWGGADGRRDSASAGANIAANEGTNEGSVPAVSFEQNCAVINANKAAAVPQ